MMQSYLGCYLEADFAPAFQPNSLI
jgi:hypothetical protein